MQMIGLIDYDLEKGMNPDELWRPLCKVTTLTRLVLMGEGTSNAVQMSWGDPYGACECGVPPTVQRLEMEVQQDWRDAYVEAAASVALASPALRSLHLVGPGRRWPPPAQPGADDGVLPTPFPACFVPWAHAYATSCPFPQSSPR